MSKDRIIINVGSTNPVKIDAVWETLQQYSFLNPFDLNSMEVSSEVSEQPRGIEEIVKGAKNRAKNSFMMCNYSIGLESGPIAAGLVAERPAGTWRTVSVPEARGPPRATHMG